MKQCLGLGIRGNSLVTSEKDKIAYICFHISSRIRIRIRIVSAMPDMIRLDVDIINMRFEYSDTDTVSDVEQCFCRR